MKNLKLILDGNTSLKSDPYHLKSKARPRSEWNLTGDCCGDSKLIYLLISFQYISLVRLASPSHNRPHHFPVSLCYLTMF